MKKTLLLLALIPCYLLAQSPFGQDATWYFSYSAFGFNGYKKVSYTKDSIIQDRTWQVFTVTGLSELKTGPGPDDIIQDTNAVFNDVLLSTRNDSVFYFDAQGSIHVLFDFNANVGDQWQFAYPTTTLGCYALPKATVMAVGYDTINGTPLKYWEIENPMDTFIIQNQKIYMCASGYCLPTKIYKDVGALWYSELFNPSPNICNGNMINLAYNQLRCFSNNAINVNFTNKACDYWSLIGVEENKISAVKIYPNPSNGFVFIEAEKAIAKTEVYNITGQKLRAYTNEKTIELPEQSGLYLVHITLENGGILVEKVVKE